MAKKYTNISFPDSLVKEIDLLVKRGVLGYQSRADFAKEAIRVFIRDLAKYEEIKKINLKTK
ncbi:MAG: ribbon-helix-helix domain-containing protein [Candidatus Woesearchaeota archaeon]|nr:ribbon-helix-helix domain-containing protein [Candidatus Woesearchaeota archaeon]